MLTKFVIPGGEYFSDKNTIWQGDMPDALSLPVGAAFAIKTHAGTGYFIIGYIGLEIDGNRPCLIYYVQPKLPTKEGDIKKLLGDDEAKDGPNLLVEAA